MRSFNAITTKDEAVALVIEHNLVTANITDATGQTLLVSVSSVRMVQELVDFAPTSTATASAPKGNTAKGAAGSPGHHTAPRSSSPPRWAISTSSSSSRTCGADDNGHREIVDFPLRRGGGWRRWKTRHVKVKRAAEKIYCFGRFFVWKAPRFFLWTVLGVCQRHQVCCRVGVETLETVQRVTERCASAPCGVETVESDPEGR